MAFELYHAPFIPQSEALQRSCSPADVAPLLHNQVKYAITDPKQFEGCSSDVADSTPRVCVCVLACVLVRVGAFSDGSGVKSRLKVQRQYLRGFVVPLAEQSTHGFLPL